jgi:Fe-S cluster biogenesis protein NfuA
MSQSEKNTLLQRIEVALNQVRPHLAVDGGNVEVIEVTDTNILKIKWLGNCEGCSMSVFTMRAGIEEVVKRQVPEIVGVEAVNAN